MLYVPLGPFQTLYKVSLYAGKPSDMDKARIQLGISSSSFLVVLFGQFFLSTNLMSRLVEKEKTKALDNQTTCQQRGFNFQKLGTTEHPAITAPGRQQQALSVGSSSNQQNSGPILGSEMSWVTAWKSKAFLPTKDYFLGSPLNHFSVGHNVFSFEGA